MNYLVVLFKNKERKKIINKFVTAEKAKKFFDSLIEKNSTVQFEVQVENANVINYELCLLQKRDENFDKIFIKDSLGRQILVETDDPNYKIIRVENYKISEKIFDIEKKTKITLEEFIKKYLSNFDLKLLSKLNNKVVLQNNDIVKLFSLKNENESKRFLETLNHLMMKSQRTDCIIVSDSSKSQKKYLYNILNNQGFHKQSLYRKSTTFKHR